MYGLPYMGYGNKLFLFKIYLFDQNMFAIYDI